MKAAVFREVDVPLEIEEVHIDSPAPHEVLIRTGASGVCHSDLHYMEGKYYMDTPAVLGHEAAGTVEAVGSQVRYVKPGDRVITCLSVFCGECDMCLKGRQVLCRREAGVVREPSEPPRLSQNGSPVTQGMVLGAYAELMLVHEHSVVKVRDDVPFEVLALIGCGVTTGVGAALNTARVEPGSTVAVLGCGGVGLSVVGCKRIRARGSRALGGSSRSTRWRRSWAWRESAWRHGRGRRFGRRRGGDRLGRCQLHPQGWSVPSGTTDQGGL